MLFVEWSREIDISITNTFDREEKFYYIDIRLETRIFISIILNFIM